MTLTDMIVLNDQLNILPGSSTMISHDIGSTNSNKTHNQSGTPEGNRRKVLKLILDYYNKYDQLSRATEDGWRRNFSKLKSISEEYNTELRIRFTHLAHSSKPTRQAY